MTQPSTRFDAIVLGAGAAGLMCALTAAHRGRKVLLLEHTDKAGAKILISGGGRCNFTNLDIQPNRFVSANPQFCASALKRYSQHDFIAFVEKHGIAYHEKTLGQLFCDGSARQIVAMLLAECATGSVDLRTDCAITDVTRGDQFTVSTGSGRFTAPSLVIATGGLSIPKMGATGFGYDLARKFGLSIVETRPGLVPLKMAELAGAPPSALAGVAATAIAKYGSHQFRESVLVTHRGLSGPAILQISSYWQPGGTIVLDLLPDLAAADVFLEYKKKRPKLQPQTMLAEVLPARLAQALANAHLSPKELSNIPDRELVACGKTLKAWPIVPDGTEGYAKAEVTTGGVDTRQLSQKTMAARDVPGLHVIGEAVDVTGWLGGYNFQWAWSSGWAAGQAL